jgi:hypothetical protein
MITTKDNDSQQHNGLNTYILHQLKQTLKPTFLRYIQDLHVQYQEAKLTKYIPHRLILDVQDKISVLKHKEVLNTTDSTNTPAMVLITTPSMTN